MNDVVADLTLKPTILEIDRFFSEQDVTTTKEYEKPKKVLKVKPAAAPSLFAPDDVSRSREMQSRGRRFRKNKDQIMYLVNEYRKNPNWTRRQCVRFAETLNLSLH